MNSQEMRELAERVQLLAERVSALEETLEETFLLHGLPPPGNAVSVELGAVASIAGFMHSPGYEDECWAGDQ